MAARKAAAKTAAKTTKTQPKPTPAPDPVVPEPEPTVAAPAARFGHTFVAAPTPPGVDWADAALGATHDANKAALLNTALHQGVTVTGPVTFDGAEVTGDGSVLLTYSVAREGQG